MTSDNNLFVELKSRNILMQQRLQKVHSQVTSTTRKVSTRAKGRQIAIKYSSTGTDDNWSLGDFRVMQERQVQDETQKDCQQLIPH